MPPYDVSKRLAARTDSLGVQLGIGISKLHSNWSIPAWAGVIGTPSGSIPFCCRTYTSEDLHRIGAVWLQKLPGPKNFGGCCRRRSSRIRSARNNARTGRPADRVCCHATGFAVRSTRAAAARVRPTSFAVTFTSFAVRPHLFCCHVFGPFPSAADPHCTRACVPTSGPTWRSGTSPHCTRACVPADGTRRITTAALPPPPPRAPAPADATRRITTAVPSLHARVRTPSPSAVDPCAPPRRRTVSNSGASVGRSWFKGY